MADTGLLDWADTQPDWTRDALRRHASRPAFILAEDDKVAIETLVRQAGGYEIQDVPATSPLTGDHLKTEESGSKRAVLCSLGPVKHLNRLAEAQQLRFASDGLTIIYGENGTGKSGYCRIVKKLCRSLTADDLLGNVFEAGSKPPAEVVVRFLEEGETEPVAATWRDDGTAPPAQIARISVFDSANARLYVDRQNRIGFLPAEIALLEKHGLHRGELEKEFREEIKGIDKTLRTPLPGGYSSDGTVSKLLARLDVKSKEPLPTKAEIEQLSALSGDESADLADLERTLANDPSTMAARRRRAKTVLAMTKAESEKIDAVLSTEMIGKYRAALSKAYATAEAATLSASGAFSSMPLTGAGLSPWRLMFDYSRRCDKGQDSGRLLEFRGGTSARPILSPAPGTPVPIDGGTRIEVLLKVHPHEAGGLLHINSYSKRTMSLATLVGAVAPNLDVATEIIVKEGTEQVAQPGDWLKISDMDLVRRLNPIADRTDADSPKADRALMQTIEDESGQIFGRAFISPSRYSFSADGGWVTISGLRAGRLHNVEGILLGEAVTAARDAAQPLAPRDALARWASKQADLIAASVKDEERQARSAEVVLECGGEIGGLKFAKWGTDWLGTDEFQERLESTSEIAVSFVGEFDYDEDKDDVHPKEFREDFQVSEDIVVILKHDGGILKVGNSSWPKSVTGQDKWGDSNVAQYTRNLIRQAWGESIQENEEERVVGKVGFSEIGREVTVFRAPDESEDGNEPNGPEPVIL